MLRKECWIAPAVLILDRVTKIAAEGLPPEGRILIPGVLGLRYVRNTGVAFSLFSQVPFLPAVLTAAVLIAAFFLLRKKKLSPLPFCGLMAMLGGALGNLIDRVFSGSVPDMIEPLFVSFAIFNVADIGITVGCGLVMLYLLLPEKERKDGSPNGTQ